MDNHIVYTLASAQPSGSMRGPGIDINQTLPGQYQFPNQPCTATAPNIPPFGNTVHHYMLPKQPNFRGVPSYGKNFNPFPPPPLVERGLNLHKPAPSEIPLKTSTEVMPMPLPPPISAPQQTTPEVLPSCSSEEKRPDKVSSVVGAASEALAMLCTESTAIPEEFTITIYDANQDMVDHDGLSMNGNSAGSSSKQGNDAGAVVTCITFTEENGDGPKVDILHKTDDTVGKIKMEGENKDDQENVDDLLEIFPFICGFCNKRFNRIHKYFDHVSSHEENKDEYFHVCGPKDKEKENDSGVEVEEKFVYSCGVCQKVFKTICHLHDHIINVEQLDRYVVNKAKSSLTKKKPIYYDDDDTDDVTYCQHPRKRFTKKAVKKETKPEKRKGSAKRKPYCVRGRPRKIKVDIDENLDGETSESRDIRESREAKRQRYSMEHQAYLKKKRTEYKRRVEKKKKAKEEMRLRKLGLLKDDEGEETENLESIDKDALTEGRQAKDTAPPPKKKRKKYTRRKPIIPAGESIGEQMAVCHKCGNMYKRSQLASHMHIHKEERRFACKICGKAFKASHQLTTHMVSHSSEKNFACEVCGRCYKTAGNYPIP